MKALVSGQAGLAVVLSEPPVFRPVRQHPFVGRSDEIWLAFEGFQDVEEVDVDDDDMRVLDRRAVVAWAQDRAIYRLLMLFDGEDLDPSSERGIVEEYVALVHGNEIGDTIGDWLERVELGPRHLERARSIALKYSSMREPMARLYPAISRDVERWGAETRRAAEKLEQKAVRIRALVRDKHLARERHSRAGKHATYRSIVRKRPDSSLEKQAKALLEPILKAAKRALGNVPVARGMKTGPQAVARAYHLKRVVAEAAREAEVALRVAKLDEDVRPFSEAEIRVLLKRMDEASDKRSQVRRRA